MQGHINQATHNDNFVSDCCSNYPDNYFDWKVTATFYLCLHLLKAFCLQRGVDPGNTHSEIRVSLNPKGNPTTQIKQHAWKAYNKLQHYSEVARYHVFLDPILENEIQKSNFEHSVALCKELQGYFINEGIKINKADAA